MNRNFVLMPALCLALTVALAPAAEAGRKADTKKLSSKRTEMPAEMSKAHRFDRLPEMQFHTGVLSRDGVSGWRVGDYRLQLSSESIITGADGQTGLLQEGSRVLVMGPSFGDTFVGWNVQLLGPEMPANGKSAGVVKQPSDSDPDVGELVSAPY